MGYISDALGFEAFHGKDLWKRLKKDPKRLILGVDPWSTKVWNKVLNKDDEPLVDQLGGAYGGHTFSFGEAGQDKGVYSRAREAGINTGPAQGLQDVAHIISASFGAKGIGGIGGGNGSPGGQQGMPQMNMMPQQQQPRNTFLEDELKRQEEERILRAKIAEQLGERRYV